MTMEISRSDNLLPRLSRAGVRESQRVAIPAGARAVSVHVKMDAAQKVDPTQHFSLAVWVLDKGAPRYYGGQTWDGGNFVGKDGTPNPDPILRVGPLAAFAGREELSIVFNSTKALDYSCDVIFDDDA